MPNDPLYNNRDSASRELVRQNVIYDNFCTHYPLMSLLKTAGVVDEVFQGTGVLEPFIYDLPNGSATVPGATITPTRKQISTNAKFDERFYQTNLSIEETEYRLYNAPGDTRIYDAEAKDTYALTKKMEMMIELDAYRHGQPASGNGYSTSGVVDDRRYSSNGLDEGLNNGVDPSPFGNVYTLYGGVTRNGVEGQAYNSTPYYCGNSAGVSQGITFPILQRAIAQLSSYGVAAKAGFVGPFGWGALAVMLRTSSWVQQENVTEGYDFGWRSVNFNGIKIHEDPCAPSSVTYKYIPGANQAAYNQTNAPTFADGSGSFTKLASFVSPTYTINGQAVSAGTLSPTGSNVPSATTINPGEALYLIDPEAMKVLPPKPGSGWNFDIRETQVPNNISTNYKYMKLATNVYTPQPTHGMIIFGFRGVAS